MNILKNNIVITGEWDGKPIWREKTAHEKLVGVLKDKWIEKQAKEEKKILKVDKLLDNEL